MISGKAIITGVIGFPVSHSLSPKLHNHWLEKYKIDGAYLPFPIAPEDLPKSLKALSKFGIRGVNVTVPHKEAVLPFMDKVDAAANAIGAVNTIVVEEEGALIGSNTDAYGFMQNIKSIGNAAPYLKHAVVLGAGGAARAVVYALLEEKVEKITLINRTREKAESLAENYQGVVVADWDERTEALAAATLLVNTTTLGMQGFQALDLNLHDLPKEALVTDLVYAPLKTDLLKSAEARGNKTVDGLGMLIHQAVAGFAAWYGITPEVTAETRKVLLT